MKFQLASKRKDSWDHIEHLKIDADRTLEIALDPRPVVEGSISLPDGTPVADADVELWSAYSEDEEASQPNLSAAEKTNSDGGYRLVVLHPEDLFHVRARDERGRHGDSEPFTLVPGALRTEVPVVLDWTGGQIVVHVVDAEGSAVPGLLVRVTSWADGVPTEDDLPTTCEYGPWTNSQGIAVCDTLRTGPHLVRVSLKGRSKQPPFPETLGATFHLVRVDVDRGARVELEVPYPKSQSLVGLVVDSAGEPLGGVSIDFETKILDPWLGEVSEIQFAETSRVADSGSTDSS